MDKADDRTPHERDEQAAKRYFWHLANNRVASGLLEIAEGVSVRYDIYIEEQQ